jgi:hypothetical protein
MKQNIRIEYKKFLVALSSHSNSLIINTIHFRNLAYAELQK